MESERGSGNDIHTSPPLDHQEENDEQQQEEDAANNAIDLKKRISGHPLYEQLVQTHLDCLKAGGVDTGDLEINDSKYMKQVPGAPTLDESTELDQFMEAYCLALGKLKEAIEEPQQDSMVFINNMHLQLKELTTYSHPPEPATATTTVLTSENDSVQDQEGRPGIMRAGLGRIFSDDFGLSINYARIKIQASNSTLTHCPESEEIQDHLCIIMQDSTLIKSLNVGDLLASLFTSVP